MNIHKKSNKQTEKVLLGGMAAAALGLINAKPKVVNAATSPRNKVTRNNKENSVKTKISYQTARNSTKTYRVSAKQPNSLLRSSELDDANSSNPTEKASTNIDTKTEQTTSSVSYSQQKDDYNNDLDPKANQNTNNKTSKDTYQDNNSTYIDPKSDSESSSVIETTWCTVPITINTDTGILTIKGGTTAFTYLPGIIDADDGIAAVLESFDADIVNKIKKINIVDTVIINGEGRYMFRNLPNLTEITGLENLDTVTFKRVTSLKDLFENDKNLVTIKGLEKNAKTKFDTSKLNDLTEMFKGCSSLSTLDLSGIDMSKVNSWTNMFADCSNLTTLTLGEKSKFDITAGLSVSGTWVNMGNGQHKKGTKSLSSDELMSTYNGNEDADTFTRYTGGKITVHYQDNKNNDIPDMDHDDQFGNIGDSLVNDDPITAFQPKDKVTINGKAYTLSGAKIKDNPVDLKDVKFTADPQDVTLIYAPEEVKPVAAKPVKVYYKYRDKDDHNKLNDILDETGKPKTKTISGNIGDKPTVTFDDLANYKKDSYKINDTETHSTDDFTIPLSDQEQTVTLIYTQDSAEPVAAKPVTVYYKYKDKDGKLNDILDETGKPKTKTISGNIGDKPVVTFDELAHYKKDSYQINTDPVTVSTDNPAVTLSNHDQTVTLIYTKVSGNNSSNGSGSNNTPGNNSSNGSGSINTPGNNSSNGSGSNNTPGNSSSNGSGNNGSGSNGQNNGSNLPNNEPNNIPTPVNRKPKTVRPHKTINKGFNIKDQNAIRNQQLANSLKNNGSSSNAQNSASNTLPQTGNDKHNSLAMLALGGLALATALGAAWFGRKKD